MTEAFKIYSLLLVKNEADVIEASVVDACRWSDKIIVIDNGSTDGTWEKIKALSKTHEQIVPFMQYTGGYHIGLRAKAFHAFRKEMTRNDWWCVRLDADEFYPGDVRAFLSQVPRRYNIVKKESTDYVITREDLKEKAFTGEFLEDRSLITHALADKRRERRFMRHSPLLCWRETWRYPHPWGLTSPDAIAVDHYQYRSREQMETRFLTRQKAKADGCGSFHHEKGSGWEDYLLSNEQLRLQHIIKNIREEFRNADAVMHGGRNTIKLLHEKYVVKSFGKPALANRIIYGCLRKSKAERSYLYAKRLGDKTPEPIGWVDIKKHGMLQESYYISRLSDRPYTFRQLEHDPAFPNRAKHIAALARFTAALHENGIIHHDYSGGNMLFDDEGRYQLVDLNRMSFGQHISLRRGCKNFERLNLTEEEYDLVGREYAKARGFDPDLCARLVKQMRWKKH